MDGTGFWVVGDPQRTLYVANGALTGTVVNSNANNADYNGNLQLQGCTAYPANGALPTVVYFVRSSEYYVYLDQTTTPTQNWATNMSLTVLTNPQFVSSAPLFGGQVRLSTHCVRSARIGRVLSRVGARGVRLFLRTLC